MLILASADRKHAAALQRLLCSPHIPPAPSPAPAAGLGNTTSSLQSVLSLDSTSPSISPAPSPPPSPNTDSSSGSSVPIGAIVGGIVGGAVLLALAALLLVRRRRRAGYAQRLAVGDGSESPKVGAMEAGRGAELLGFPKPGDVPSGYKVAVAAGEWCGPVRGRMQIGGMESWELHEQKAAAAITKEPAGTACAAVVHAYISSLHLPTPPAPIALAAGGSASTALQLDADSLTRGPPADIISFLADDGAVPAAEAPHRDSPGGSNGGREGRPSGELSKQRSLAPSSRLGSGVSELWTVDFRELDIQKEVGAGSFGKVRALFLFFLGGGGACGHVPGGWRPGGEGTPAPLQVMLFPKLLLVCSCRPARPRPLIPAHHALPTGALSTCAEERRRHPWSLPLAACPCRPGCAWSPCSSSP